MGGSLRVTLAGYSGGRGTGSPGRTVDRAARSQPARWVGAFGDLKAGELGLLVDSSGWLAIVLRQASAADHLRPITVGDIVRIVADRGPDVAG